MKKNTPPLKAKTQIINGKRYVFIAKGFWNKEKKYPDHKRVYIGKYDDEGNYIPYPESQPSKNQKESVNNVKTITPTNSYFYGATYLLDEITRMTGIGEDLRLSFPNDYSMLLSLAYYLVLESDSPMYRFKRWDRKHKHPYGCNISSQRSSELLSNILEAGKLDFFNRQAKRRLENEFLAYDTTSITSTSELIKSARYGLNKDHDDLPQVNLALLFGEKSLLPVYYRVLPGNISDVTTIKKLSKDLTFLNIKNLKLVLDRGFYSEKNIDMLYISDYEFILSMKQNIKFVKECLDLSKEEIKLYSHHDKIFDMHHCMYEYEWNYSIINNKRQGTENSKKLYVHVYYNRNKETTEYNNFNKKLIKIQDKIANKETLTEKEKNLFHKFFEICNTSSKFKVKFKENIIQEHTKYFGYFVLVSNKIKDSSIVLTYYRQRDVVEKAFDNLKDKLEMKRTLVHSDMAFNGKCFINFLALIYISYIHKQMLETNLYKNYTMASLLDDLEVIELYEYGSMPAHYSEITKKQIEIYAKLGVQPPDLCINSGA